DFDGPFAPERAGALPTYSLLEIAMDGHHSLTGLKKSLQREGGLVSHLGTADARQVEKRIAAGDDYAALVYQAMALSVARSIASLAVVVCGQVDAIILTGGVAYSQMFTEMITDRIKFIAPVTVLAGENEMKALAEGAWRVINGLEQPNCYQ
ncbi:MAG: ROK family protein, partial [Clostridiales bacterium]